MGWFCWPWPFIAAPSVPSIVVWGLEKVAGGVVDVAPPDGGGVVDEVLENCVLDIAATLASPWATAMPAAMDARIGADGSGIVIWDLYAPCAAAKVSIMVWAIPAALLMLNALF